MPDHIFVGRENELRQLQHFLDQANAGNAQIGFVAGEAGAGKSALVQEFVRRAQETDAKVVAAIGECNAQTGAGDSYLPFRQVLTVLTGADDEKQSANKVSTTNSARLKEFVRVSGETLLDVGPDLVGIFVPGASLVVKLATKAATHSKLADRLAEQLGKPEKPGDRVAINPQLDQEKIFEQYTNVLQALAQEHTLILILDDLQWADSASLNLMFHLARQLKSSRVLIVGTFRPDDVAQGRNNERHPLEPILNELKRYNGDIVIDLDATRATEGRAFVDALIDAEPNRLDERFRAELFARTDGHPLFTVELLRNLQERGDLVKDSEGHWVEGAALDWNALPARVEGVIAERIGRLAENLREDLTVASVMGVDFTAQVIARVQQVQERELVTDLARELDTRYRLVQEQGEIKIGKQFLTQYRFTHALFQQFLYNELHVSERRLMHEDVGAALEACYEGHTDEIAPQLARHFQEAGDDAKTFEYSMRAGDAAARVYAQTEARVHYAQAVDALARLPDTEENRRQRVDTLIKQVSVSHIAVAPEQSLERLRQARALLEHLTDGAPDRLRLARIYYWMGQVYVSGNQLREALECMNRVLPIAQELNDAELLAASSLVIGRALFFQGRFDRADALLTQAVQSLEQVENWSDWIMAVGLHAFVLAARGRYAEGIAEGQRGVTQATAVNSLTGIGQSHGLLGNVYMMGRDFTQALEQAQVGLDAGMQSGNQLLVYTQLGSSAWAHERQGDLQSAEQEMAQTEAIGERLGGSLFSSQWFALVRAEMALLQNRAHDAQTLAGEIANQAHAVGNIFVEGWAQRVEGEAVARLEPPRWEEAEGHLAEGLRLSEEGDARLEAAHTHVAWGKMLMQRGDHTRAREHLDKAAAQFQVSGLEHDLTETRNMIAGLGIFK